MNRVRVSLQRSLLLSIIGPWCFSVIQAAQANPSVRLDLAPRPETCAADFKGLVAQMLLVLPSYANRVYTRSGLPQRYMLIASPPDFEPLPLGLVPPGPKSSEVQQVFFTTLTRRYQDQQSENLQDYHWLFLTRSDTGWRFSMLYTMFGNYPQLNPPTPPRDTSEGALATAIRGWLRDCRTTR
ncbi:MAG: hypothetical protein WA902_00810 [Thermosynechococcaceae cyanobacterium]